MEEVIFIDPNGNIIQYDNICSHVGVAAKLISENEELKQRYQESGCRVPNMFLMVYEGYIAVSVDPIYGMNLTAGFKAEIFVIIVLTSKSPLNAFLRLGSNLKLI